MIKNITVLLALCAVSLSAVATEMQEVYKLSYIEREQGTDEYEMSMLVSDRYVRIDEIGEDSGFIVYDDKEKIIYSTSNHDHSVLVIKEHKFSVETSPAKALVEYIELADAPKVSGEHVYNYREYVANKDRNPIGDDVEITCLEIQLVENILPKVRRILQNYQKVVSGQQVKMVSNEISDMQSSCYFVDQVYNIGAYYEKGLPVQEWHSNGRSKILTGYEKVSVDSKKFKVPEDYRHFSIGMDSKTFIN